MKMFEYMAAGRAILSSNLPVLREVLDETRAVFCPPENSADWVRAFGQLVETPELRTRLGAAALTAVEQYAWQERARRCLAGMD